MLNWDDAHILLSVVKTSKIGAAAGRVGVSDAAVRRRLAGLDALGGGPLFERLEGRPAPSDLGRKLGDLAADIDADLSPLLLRAGRGVKGHVRVTATELIGVDVLPPLFADLGARHPGIGLTLSISLRNEDLLRAEADIAVRIARPTQQSLATRSVFLGRLGLFAHRDYIAQAGEPRTLADLARFEIIGSPGHSATVAVLGEMGLKVSKRDFAYLFESQGAQLEAVRLGLGVGVALDSVAARFPELVAVLPELHIDRAAWICMHEDLQVMPAARTVFDALVDFFQGATARTGAARV